MTDSELKSFLDEKFEQYAQPEFFIPTDPIQVPLSFEEEKDREIAGFLTALISWGQRKTIIHNAKLWMQLMDDSPYQFMMHAKDNDFERFKILKHRTLNGEDASFISSRLSRLIKLHGSIDRFMQQFPGGLKEKLQGLHHFFVYENTPQRSTKHLANPAKGSAAKRLCMYFRWMVRGSMPGIDYGNWTCLNTADLMLPLDTHTASVSRKLGLLSRKQNDWKAVEEVTEKLRTLDPTDPVKYDYALFGLGAFEKF
ncbi:MAG: TIGR02757 family protein [Luteibaculum sp.]